MEKTIVDLRDVVDVSEFYEEGNGTKLNKKEEVLDVWIVLV